MGLFLNTKCVTRDGTKCASLTEKGFYEALQALGHPFEFQVQIELVGPAIRKPATKKQRDQFPLFRDRGAEAIKLTVDFVFEHDGITYYCDTKGNKKRTERDCKMRYDMLKHRLHAEGKAETSRVLFISSAETVRLAQYATLDKKNFWNVFLQIKER